MILHRKAILHSESGITEVRGRAGEILEAFAPETARLSNACVPKKLFFNPILEKKMGVSHLFSVKASTDHEKQKKC